jgi:hypothetical protein
LEHHAHAYSARAEKDIDDVYRTIERLLIYLVHPEEGAKAPGILTTYESAKITNQENTRTRSNILNCKTGEEKEQEEFIITFHTCGNTPPLFLRQQATDNIADLKLAGL